MKKRFLMVGGTGMKKVNVVLFSFAISLVFSMVLAAPALAVDATDSVEATVLSEEEINRIPGVVLVGTQTLNFIIDENGNLTDIVEGEISSNLDIPSLCSSSTDWNGQSHKATVKLYKSGTNYYVSLTVTAAKDWWITKIELSNRAVGDSDWATLEKTYNNEPNSITERSNSVYFPDSPCDVEVKGYIAVKSTGVLDKSYNWYGKVTLDKP